MKIKTRFAPSPTGYLHFGNMRTAIVNWLFIRKKGGEFILRIDDTDRERSEEKYTEAIKTDLKWLGINYDSSFKQSSRIKRYEEIKEQLIHEGKLYPCYETKEELEMKKKFLLQRGLPPIYDRAALKICESEKQKFIDEGRKPHYRFLLPDVEIKWNDLIRGEIRIHAKKLSDPILIRGDGSMTYMLSSVIDDVDSNITHVFRGEDHITNTAIGIELMNAICKTEIQYAHLSLLKSSTGEMSKRKGSFAIRDYKEKSFHPMAINSYLGMIGTSKPIDIYKNLDDIVSQFDINSFSKATANFQEEELIRLNHKFISESSFEEIELHLKENQVFVSKDFFDTVKANVNTVSEIKEWDAIYHRPLTPIIDEGDRDYLKLARDLLPNVVDSDTWDVWTKILKEESGRKGKKLFMPLRLALTGRDYGPELKKILPEIGRDVILLRLSGEVS